MVTVLVIVYTALVVLLFKFKLLKPRPYAIAWVAVAGILLIGGVVVVWHLCAPMSTRVVSTQYVVQLVSYVKGQVQKVHARANQPVKKGDLLLEINPAPYEFTFSQAAAQLDSAKEGVKQAQAGLESAQAAVSKALAAIKQAQATVTQAKAGVTNAQAALVKAKAGIATAQADVAKAKAADDLAITEEQIAVNLQKTDPGAISVLRVTQAQQNRAAADASLKAAQTGVNQANAAEQQASAAVNQAEAVLNQASAGLVEAEAAEKQAEASERQASFSVKVAQGNVIVAQAQLDDAKFNLTQCRMLAPADGYVVDWQVQEGSMISTVRASACGTFIVTAETFIAASFPQNYLTYVQPGDDVEVVLDPYPGRLFKAKVDAVIPATGEGQFAPSGTIPEASKVGSQGLLAVKIRLVDGALPANLPLGAGGAVVIYTNHGKAVHVISKVTIRMKKWLLYVLPSVSSS